MTTPKSGWIERVLNSGTELSQVRNELFEAYRPYLVYRARQNGNLARLQAKFDASDVVQITLLKAQKSFSTFQGNSEQQLTKWLETILANVILDSLKSYTSDKRDVSREYTIPDPLGSATVAFFTPADPGDSPSQKLIQGENAIELAAAIDRLPESQAIAITLKYLEGRTLAETAKVLERSTTATAGLLKRGMQNLRSSLPQILTP